MAKRHLYNCISENDWSWRAATPGIFQESNLSLPLCRRISRQMGAKAILYFFGTEPYFSCYPVGGSDKEFADGLQTIAALKLKDSGSHSVLREGTLKVFDLGESVFKIWQKESRRFFRKRMVVASDGRGGSLLASDGMPITPEDLWIPLDPAAPDGPAVLARDKKTPRPDVLAWEEQLTDQDIIIYKGPVIEKIYFRDFLCPLNAPTIEDADCVVHVMALTASQLAAAYMESDQQTLDSLRAAIATIRDALNSPKEGQTASSLRPESGEVTAPQTLDPTMRIGEFYLRYDADQDGNEEDIMLVMDLNTNTPIYYNYTANVTDDGLRPFRCLRASAVENRWYGIGAIEMFEQHQKTIDLMINRRNKNQSEAGRITAFRHDLTVEYDSNPNFRINWGKGFTPKPGARMEDIVQVAYLDDNKYDRLTEEIQFFLQAAMNESGVQHANDSYMAGMDSSKLATGIKNVEKTGNELFGVAISNLESGMESTLRAFVTTLYANLDQEETAEVLEGDVPVQFTVNPKMVHGLSFNVSVLLTRQREEQIMASSQQSTALVQSYYAMPPQLQQILAPFFTAQLKALQVPNAKAYIIPQQFALGAGPTVPNVGTPTPDATIAPPPNL